MKKFVLVPLLALTLSCFAPQPADAGTSFVFSFGVPFYFGPPYAFGYPYYFGPSFGFGFYRPYFYGRYGSFYRPHYYYGRRYYRRW
ncbi:MAG: hypothetical protein JOY96_08780 [Verrucomicrobia bacterium]|nr:hypothetical protein [Verrucomicrobiota bacterium]MBV9674324.1 hypothetical protein [Verrucomicrobiota bacterium]